MNSKTPLALATATLMTLALGGCASTGMDTGADGADMAADTSMSGGSGSAMSPTTSGSTAGTATTGSATAGGTTAGTTAGTTTGSTLGGDSASGASTMSGSTAGTAAAGTAATASVASGDAHGAHGAQSGHAGHAAAGNSAAAAPMTPPKANSPAEALTLVALVDEHELKLAQLTQSKQVSEPVMAYAKMMVADHTPHLAKTRSLADTTGGLQPRSDGARQLMMIDQQTQQRLSGLEGDAYARVYMDHMVQSHQMGIAMLDASMGVATDAAQREFLTMTRQTMQKHLQHAQKVRGQLKG